MRLTNTLTEIIDDNQWIVSYLRSKGFDVEKITNDDWVSNGSISFVYSINKNKILKISTRNNLPEIDEYAKLVGKNFQNVAKIYFAKTFTDFDNTGVVIMEKLFQNDANLYFKEKTIDYDVIYHMMNFHIDNPHLRSAKNLIRMIAEHNGMKVSEFFRNGMQEEGLEFCQQVLRGIFELESVGAHYNDIHLNNVMIDRKRNNKIVDFYNS